MVFVNDQNNESFSENVETIQTLNKNDIKKQMNFKASEYAQLDELKKQSDDIKVRKIELLDELIELAEQLNNVLALRQSTSVTSNYVEVTFQKKKI